VLEPRQNVPPFFGATSKNNLLIPAASRSDYELVGFAVESSLLALLRSFLPQLLHLLFCSTHPSHSFESIPYNNAFHFFRPRRGPVRGHS
jgi:hypothetical protein